MLKDEQARRFYGRPIFIRMFEDELDREAVLRKARQVKLRGRRLTVVIFERQDDEPSGTQEDGADGER